MWQLHWLSLSERATTVLCLDHRLEVTNDVSVADEKKQCIWQADRNPWQGED
jgi:hypothetical protein